MIGICNLTGQGTQGIVKQSAGRVQATEVVGMAENKENTGQLKLTSLSHGAG